MAIVGSVSPFKKKSSPAKVPWGLIFGGIQMLQGMSAKKKAKKKLIVVVFVWGEG